jgi:hypothetical protein
LCSAVAQHAESHHAAGQLELVALVLQIGEPDLAVGGQAHHIGRVELHLGAGVGPRQELILDNQRCVEGRRHHFARVRAPHGDVSVHHTYARHAAAGTLGLVWLVLRPGRAGDSSGDDQKP